MTEYAFWRCMLRMFKWHAEGSLYLVFGVKRRGIYGFISVNILGFSLPSCTVSPSLWFASGVLFIPKPWSSNNTLTVALCILPFVTAFSLINVCTLQFPIQRDCSFSATKTHSLWLPLCFCTISNLFSNLSLYLFSYIWNAILVSNQLSHWFFFFFYHLNLLYLQIFSCIFHKTISVFFRLFKHLILKSQHDWRLLW